MKTRINLCTVLFLAIALMLGGCEKDDVKELKKQIAELQAQQKALETLVAALRNNAQITSVTQNDDGTATFIFADGYTL